jgi:hypothetical protein
MIDYSGTDDGKVQGNGTASEHVAGLLFTQNLYFLHTLYFQKTIILVPTFK